MRGPVLLHGFTGSAASWEPVINGLEAAGREPVPVDLPGHGRDAGAHDPRRFTLDAALDVIAAAGRWPADLVGYSMGGRLALHFAAAYPERVRRLVLEAASPGLDDEGERAARRRNDTALAERIVSGGVAAFVEAWEALPLFESQRSISPELLQRQRTARLANDARSLAAALVGLGTGALSPLWSRLDAISTPTLLVVGALDAKFVAVARRMEDALPNARLVVVPHAGHRVHLERPDIWVRMVRDFLA